MADKVGDESLKLTANWFNAVSAATIGAGVVIPIINQIFGEKQLNGDVLTLLVCGCVVFGLILHLAGLMILRGLDVSDD